MDTLFFIGAVITHTPLWVWAVFALVLVLGVMRTRDRVVSLPRLLILPVIMALLALSGLLNAGLGVLPEIVVGLVAGGVGGWLLERDGYSRRLPDGRLWVKGDWTSLVQILAIFVVRYVVAINAAIDPAAAATGPWHVIGAMLSAFLAALFTGRTAARLRVYFTSAPVAV